MKTKDTKKFRFFKQVSLTLLSLLVQITSSSAARNSSTALTPDPNFDQERRALEEVNKFFENGEDGASIYPLPNGQQAQFFNFPNFPNFNDFPNFPNFPNFNQWRNF